MKRFMSILLAALITFSCICPAWADEVGIAAQSAILIDSVSGEIIYEKNSHEKMYPASMTKIMTMLLCMEAIQEGKISISDKVTVTEEATRLGGTQLFLETGEIRTVEELLYGIAVESANDAATALGIYLGGSLSAFADMMNERAKILGMNDSHFVNACGLHDDDHYTSAYDMAVLSKELLKHKDIFKYISTWTTDLYIGRNNDRLRTLANTNKLLSRYDNIDGIKTGYTSESGHCMSATGKVGNTRLIAVVMRSTDANTRFNDAKMLLDYGFNLYEGTYPVKSGKSYGEVQVKNGQKETLQLLASDDIYLFGKKGEYGDITIVENISREMVYAPIKAGEILGEAEVYDGDVLIGKTELYAKEDVEKCSLGEYLRRIRSIILY